eukprot:162514-Amphidinium_carterae.1
MSQPEAVDYATGVARRLARELQRMSNEDCEQAIALVHSSVLVALSMCAQLNSPFLLRAFLLSLSSASAVLFVFVLMRLDLHHVTAQEKAL